MEAAEGKLRWTLAASLVLVGLLATASLASPRPSMAQNSDHVTLSNLQYSTGTETLTVTGTVSWNYTGAVSNRTLFLAIRGETELRGLIGEIERSAATSGTQNFEVDRWATLAISGSADRLGYSITPTDRTVFDAETVTLANGIRAQGLLSRTPTYRTNFNGGTSVALNHLLTGAYTTLYSASACSDEDVINNGNLYGYDTTIAGDFDLEEDCWINNDLVDLHGFTLTDTRTVTFTLTPPDNEHDHELAVYRGSIDEAALQTESGMGALSIENLQVTANQLHVVAVARTNAGSVDGYSLQLQYGFIQPPTPTPAPTPTPRVQPNVDFRLHPDPVGVSYEAGATYQFELEGQTHLYPVTVRSANPAALELNTSSSVTCDITAADSVEVDDGDTLYVKACTAGRNTTLEVVSEVGDYLADYSVYVSQGARPTLTAATVTQGMGEDVSQRDELGLGIVIGSVCSGFGVGCDTRLITNLLATALAVGVMAFLLQRSRGSATAMSVGVAAAFAVVAMMLAYLWVGFPLWIVGLLLIVILGAGGIAAVAKAKQVG